MVGGFRRWMDSFCVGWWVIGFQDFVDRDFVDSARWLGWEVRREGKLIVRAWSYRSLHRWLRCGAVDLLLYYYDVCRHRK